MKESKKKKRTLELLAPAGTLEVFETAVMEGADAVYVGAPFMNARALAKHFSMAEIAAMTEYAHRNDCKLYIAMNSLLKEEEIRELIFCLANLEEIGVDALIVQDMGIYRLIKRYFPRFRVHASTLCTAHNSLAVKQFEEMGFDRVVLAREMELGEIEKVRAQTKVELEVFVHGAMCFSYSGLCLFSSFLGGKSGLRGRCVQPCRRCYSWHGRKKSGQAGYLFSMNDLDSIEMVGRLQKAGVSSLKIEGRMRSSNYVGSVVRAYRMVLDGSCEDRSTVAEAVRILKGAMGRKSSTGYFIKSTNPDLISNQHSGNIGLFVGRFTKGGKHKKATIELKEGISTGDRFRIHHEVSGERNAFTLKKILLAGKIVACAESTGLVELELPVSVEKGDSLYKVDTKEARAAFRKRVKIDPSPFKKKYHNPHPNKRVSAIIREFVPVKTRSSALAAKRTAKHINRPPAKGRGRSGRQENLPIPWWLKVDNIQSIKLISGSMPERLLLTMPSDIDAIFPRLSSLRRRFRNLTLTLPPIIEQADVEVYQKAIVKVNKAGFRDFQLSHLGQLMLFSGLAKKEVNLFGDFTLNVLNSQTVRQLRELGFRSCQFSIETDQKALQEVLKQKIKMEIGLTVYCLPPLFTARPAPSFFRFNQPFISPKNELFVLKQSFGQTIALPEKPFSLLPWINELAEMGLSYAVIDLCNASITKGMISALFQSAGQKQRKGRSSTFNYRGTLF